MDNQQQYRVRHWLSLGWHDFVKTRGISMGFSSLFVIIGALAYGLLISQGLGLALLVLLTLVLLLPLRVVVLPVTAYASYAAYVDLLEQQEA